MMHRAIVTALALCALVLQPSRSAADPRFFAEESAEPSHASRLSLGRSDVAYSLVAAAAVFAAARNDQWLRNEATESPGRSGRGLARAAQPLGNTLLVFPVLAAGYGLSRAVHGNAAASGFREVAFSVVAASAGSFLVKEAIGRARPYQSPNDADRLSPFSGKTSFPSGHAAVAFSMAESINLASGSRWAPFVTYPAAALVGWSRVHDDRHWTSDVVAGAALGIWTAHKVHAFESGRSPQASRVRWGVYVHDGAPGLKVSLR